MAPEHRRDPHNLQDIGDGTVLLLNDFLQFAAIESSGFHNCVSLAGIKPIQPTDGCLARCKGSASSPGLVLSAISYSAGPVQGVFGTIDVDLCDRKPALREDRESRY